jgi:diacylglycerol kinase (ATP)
MTELRTRAIVNPRSAGRRTATRWPEVARRVEAELGAIETVFTDAPDSATRLTRQALRDGVDQIIAVGGDGTINEVVNGFFEGDAAINPEAVLAIAVLGTGGDFRKTFGIGADADDFVRRITAGRVRAVDVGHLEFVDHEGRPATRYFCNIASFGLSGEVVAAVNRAGFSKKISGKFAFQWASFTSLLRHRDAPVRITIDDEPAIERNLTIAAVCNGQFFGGGMHIAPDASPDDGLFDVVTLHDLGVLDFMRHSRLIYRGEHVHLDQVSVHRGRRVTARPSNDGDEILLDVDGEQPGRLPASFELRPRALKIRC